MSASKIVTAPETRPPNESESFEGRRQFPDQRRLARECAKLDPTAEAESAEEFLVGELDWPDY